MSPYDPSQDPRWLGTPVETDQAILDEIAKLQGIEEVLAMFQTTAWAEVQVILENSLEQAKALAIGAKTYESLCEQRGRIGALRVLIDMPAAKKLEQERLRELAAKVSDTEEEG